MYISAPKHMGHNTRRLNIILRKIAQKIRRGELADLLRRGAAELTGWYRPGNRQAPRDSFDSEYGTDTSRIVPLWKLDIDSPHREEGVRYQSLDADLLRRLIGSLPIRHESFDYIDLGSGKGRTLMVASEYPFRKIIGVEFSRELNAIANRNILRSRNPKRRCHDISTIQGDAADFAFPSTDLVIFLYNPFGATVLGRVLENLVRSLNDRNRDIWLIYHNPVHADLFDRSEFFERIGLPVEATIYRSRRLSPK